MVVVSSGERVCDKYNITLRTVKEHMDGGMLEPLQEETFLIYAQKTSSGKYQVGSHCISTANSCFQQLNTIVMFFLF